MRQKTAIFAAKNTKYMKDVLIFIGGVIVGVIVTFLVALALSHENGSGNDNSTLEDKSNSDITLFDEPGDVLNYDKYKVFQVLDDNHALVKSNINYSWYDGPIFLLTNDNGKYYYDDEVIKVPKGKVMRQIGIFRYENSLENNKTVAIIKIVDK